MANFNQWIGLGNLTRDPERRELGGGGGVTRFAIAVNREYTDKSGSKAKETLFMDVEAWAQTGVLIAERLRKGDPIFVVGRLRLDTWEKDGRKNSKIVCVLDQFQFVGGRRDGPHETGDRPVSRPPDSPRREDDAGGSFDDAPF